MISRLSKDSGLYLLGTLAKMGTILLVPLYTQTYSLAEYGLLEYAIGWLNMLTIFAGLGLHQLASVHYHKYPDLRSASFATAGVLFLCYWIPVVALLVLFSPLRQALAELLFENRETLFVLVLLGTAVYFYYQLLLSYLKISLRVWHHLLVSAANLLTLVAATLLVVWGLGKGVDWAFAAYPASYLIPLVIVVTLLAKGNFRPLRRVLNRLLPATDYLRLAAPLMASNLLVWIISTSDRLLVMQLVGAEANGAYSLSYRIASILPMVMVSVVGGVYSPRIYRLFRQANFRRGARLNKEFLFWYCCFSFLCQAFVFLVAHAVGSQLFGDAFLSASPLLPGLIAGVALLGPTYVASYPLVYKERTTTVMLVYVWGSIANVGLNLLLLPSIGAFGAVVSTAVSYAACLSAFLILTPGQIRPRRFIRGPLATYRDFRRLMQSSQSPQRSDL